MYAIDWRRNIQMKQYSIEITNLAEHDLESIGDYIAYELLSPNTAVNMISGIQKQINKLKNFPKRNEFDEDYILAQLGVRKDYYKNYKIYYLIDDNKNVIYIIRILHMLVDSKALLYHAFGLK